MEKIEFTLTRTRRFNLEPYGRFTIKWKTRQGHLPRIIPFVELTIDHISAMPTTEEQDREIVKFMKKHKTDILTDGRFLYTRAGSGFSIVNHKKFEMYRDDPTFKELVDRD